MHTELRDLLTFSSDGEDDKMLQSFSWLHAIVMSWMQGARVIHIYVFVLINDCGLFCRCCFKAFFYALCLMRTYQFTVGMNVCFLWVSDNSFYTKYSAALEFTRDVLRCFSAPHFQTFWMCASQVYSVFCV
jgi:hypothetical protein